MNGLLLGFGLAVGEATGTRLAPVNSEIDPVDTVVMSGDS
jgi:hypothetical protein